MFACKIEEIVLVNKLVPVMAENFVTICKYAEFHHICAEGLFQILKHPKLEKDSTAILDFLGQWIKCVGAVNKKFLSDIMDAVDLTEIPLTWVVETLSNCQTHENIESEDRNIEESSNEEDVNKVEDLAEPYCLRIDAAGEFEETIRENYLPFQIFTLDSSSAEPMAEPCRTINTYKLIDRCNKYEVQLFETNDWKTNQDVTKVYCKSVFVDALRFTIFCAGGNPESGNQFYFSNATDKHSKVYYQTYTFRPFIDCPSSKELNTYVLKDVKNLENVAVASNGTNIYLYNDAAFAFYNTERDEWISISGSTDYTRTLSPNLVSYESSLYLIGGKYLPVEAANTGVLPLAHTLSLSQANGKLFQRFDPREGKWFKLPMMKYAHYKSASCIYNDVLYVSGGDNLAFFKGYVEHFDFKAGKWNVFNITMPEPRMNHIFLAHDDKLWFFGGEAYSWQSLSNICSWYTYDMKEQDWTDIFHIPQSHGKFRTEKILDVVIDM